MTFEEQVRALCDLTQTGSVSIRQIFQTLSGKGRLLVLVLLSLPFCQPLQIPGLSTPFGLAIAFVGGRLAFGQQMWLPRKLLEITVPVKTVHSIAEHALKVMQKMGKWIRPRWFWCHDTVGMRVLNGLLLAGLGLFLALPLPIPFSNLAAAWAIVFIAFGLLEDDGLVICIGYGIALGAVALLVWTLLFITWII